LIVRFCEIFGQEANVNLTLPARISSIRRLTLTELPLVNAARPVIDGKNIRLKVKPHEIVTLGITSSP
jgi:hypothetical protein